MKSNTLITFSEELQAFITIHLDRKAVDWKHAVRIAGEQLVAIQVAEPRYIDAMIDTIIELGPYAVIAPGVALPHAGVNKGACGVGVSFTRLSTPVEFGNIDNDPVDLVIAFCTPDPKSHIKILERIAVFLSDENRRELARNAQTPTEVLEQLVGVPDEG